MALDDTFDVACGAVADFHCVAIEDLVEFVMLWKVLVDELKESFGDFGLHVLMERRIEPRDPAFTVF